MPDAALEEAPTKETVNPGLRALFDIEPPAEYPVTTTDDAGVEKPAPTAKAPEKKEEPAPPEKPADKPPEKPDALKLRLAPEFAAAEEKPAGTVEADADLLELDKAIAAAPSEKAKVDLRGLRDKLAILKTENETLRAKPAADPPDYAATKTTLEALTKERDELLAKVERANLFDSPKFQKDHLIPRQKQYERLQTIVKDAGADPGALQRAIGLSGKGRIEALDEIREQIGSEMLKGQFDRLVEDIDAKTVAINEMARNAKQTTEELRRNETVQTHEQRVAQQKQLEGLLGAAITELTDNVGLEILKKTGRPEYQWWDDQVDEIHSVAKEVFLQSTPEKAAIASVLAASAGPLGELLKATQKALKSAEQEIRELKGAEPSLKADRKAPVVSGDGGSVDDILTGLREGKYKK